MGITECCYQSRGSEGLIACSVAYVDGNDFNYSYSLKEFAVALSAGV